MLHSIASGTYTTEQTVNSGSALPRNQWVHLVYTLEGTTARIYLDGTQVGINTNVALNPGDIGAGVTTANYLGRSLFNADPRFRGQFREFAIFNRALSANEVLTRSGNTLTLSTVTLVDPAALRMAPIVDGVARTVLIPVNSGTDLTQLAPVFTPTPGTTSAPASGTTVGLTSSVAYTLTDPTGASATWTFRAAEMKSPMLPGLYADPDIAVFGGTYFIYATTDGFPGWGGTSFYVWKSTDLVNWTRSADPVLTLAGASGTVPWATGNAWAPTIIENAGKYYFYFSGNNPTYGRKTIGVAVADSPDGPFVAQPTAMIINNETITSTQSIDPDAFYDPVSGKNYLIWGSGAVGAVTADLSSDMLSIVPGTYQGPTGLTSYGEAPFLNYRDGLYHLTYSIDDTRSENYRIGYAKATSLSGPWTYRGILLQKDLSLGIKGTGHASIINVPGRDDWYIAYHLFALPNGDGTNRETTIDRVPIGVNGLFGTITPRWKVSRRSASPTPIRYRSRSRVAAASETLSAQRFPQRGRQLCFSGLVTVSKSLERARPHMF